MSSLGYQHSNLIYQSKSGSGIWIGDLTSAEQVGDLKEKNIRTVITAADGFSLSYSPDLLIKHYKYALKDHKSQLITRFFDEVSDLIDQSLKTGSMLVHCGAGVSRSTTFVIAYLISKQKMTFRQALKLCKQKRPEVCPNLGFELQLKSYEHDLLAKKQSRKSERNPFRPSLSTKNGKMLTTYQLSFPEITKFSNVLKKTAKYHNPHPLFKPKETFYGSNQSRRASRVNKSIEPKKNLYGDMTNNQIKHVGQFRFGMTDMSKWGKF